MAISGNSVWASWVIKYPWGRSHGIKSLVPYLSRGMLEPTPKFRPKTGNFESIFEKIRAQSVLISAMWEFTRKCPNSYLLGSRSEKSDFQKLYVLEFWKVCFSVFWWLMWTELANLQNAINIQEAYWPRLSGGTFKNM